jgi:20S proteasome alpha/beta subunit
MGATYSGLGPDFKVILKKARKEFQTYKLSFMDDLMPIHSLSREIANLMQVTIPITLGIYSIRRSKTFRLMQFYCWI